MAMFGLISNEISSRKRLGGIFEDKMSKVVEQTVLEGRVSDGRDVKILECAVCSQE
jgi:hypothetical protein